MTINEVDVYKIGGGVAKVDMWERVEVKSARILQMSFMGSP